jgi:uncharacterized membrane protein
MNQGTTEQTSHKNITEQKSAQRILNTKLFFIVLAIGIVILILSFIFNSSPWRQVSLIIIAADLLYAIANLVLNDKRI